MRSLRRVLVAALLPALLACAVSARVQADEPTVRARKEALIPAGKLPAWETAAERAAPIVRKPWWRAGPVLPLPPAPGYRVPAEFEPVAAFLVSEGDWSDSGWEADIEMLFAMIESGTAAEGAGAIVLTRQPQASFVNYLANEGIDLTQVRVVHVSGGLDAKWSRDFGPLSLYEGGQTGHLGFVDLHYYDHRSRDDAVAGMLAEQIGLARFGMEGDDHAPPDDVLLFLEGGNFQTDGLGTCILSNDVGTDNASRGNEQADTLAEAEALLNEYLGCKRVIWLTPPPNTGTGHVDMYAKLLTPTDILLIDMPSQSGNDGKADVIVEQNVETMRAATNLAGEHFRIHRVRIPSVEGTWTYRTYTNATILNRVVMVPTYDNQAYDEDALDVYRGILGSDYTVVGIGSSAIVAMGGAVHCTTMQIASACGDGKVQDLLFEECDGANLGGKTCATFGSPFGALACGADCRLDTSGCSMGQDAGDDGSDPPGDAAHDATQDPGAIDGGGAGQAEAFPANEAGDAWGGCLCRLDRAPQAAGGWNLMLLGLGAWLARRASRRGRSRRRAGPLGRGSRACSPTRPPGRDRHGAGGPFAGRPAEPRLR